MITGYNTDVRYGDIVLHVQTEDKGEGNPFIESLIYYGGQVVVAKRASYADKLTSGSSPDEVTALMEHQHRTMMKAIQAGKFDDKIRLFVPDKTRPGTKASTDTSDGFDFGDETGHSLDQVILEYLTNEAQQEQLILALEGDADLRAGASSMVTLRTTSSKSGGAVGGAKVHVKMISTFGGPRSLGAGETDGEGLLQLMIDIPSVEKGTAALIITANANVGQSELKHLL